MTLRLHPDEIISQSASPLLSIAPSWERVRLREVADVVNGAAFKSSLFNNDGRGEPLVRIRDVGGDEAQVHYDGPYEKRHVIDHGDLLVGMDGDFRVARWGGGRALLNQRVCRVAVKDPDLYDERLLLHVLQPYLDAVHAVTSSVTVKHLSSRTVQDLPIPLPPKAEQERIVAAIEEHLSHLDAGLQLTGSASRRMSRFGEAVEARLLAGDWPSASLASLAEFVTDGDHRPPPRVPAGVPHLTAKHVRHGQLSFDDCTFVSETGYRQTSSRYEPRCGDVIVTCVGTVGEVAVVPTGVRFSADRNLAAIRLPSSSAAGPEWVAAVLSTGHYQRRMARASGSTAQPHLYLKDLRALEVPVPPQAVQESLLGELEDFRRSRTRLERSLVLTEQRARLLRRSVLSGAFSGELVPQDPEDEPASVLLERIRAEREAATPTKRTRKAKAS